MTAELDITPLSESQQTLLETIVESVEKNDYSMYEIVLGAMILVQNGFVSPDDYSIKVGLCGERETYIQLAKEALWFNTKEESWQ